MVDNKKIFQERFRELKSKYKTYESMSEDIRITRQTIGMYYNGKSLPNCENIIKICNAFNVTSDWLLGLSDVNTKDKTTNIMDKSSTLKNAIASAIESICEDIMSTTSEEENTKRANAIKSLSEAYYIITGVNQNDKN